MHVLRWFRPDAAWLFAGAWVLLVAASFLWSQRQREHMTVAVATAEARSSFEKDLLYRRWIAIQGGVYVPATEQTPPNPFLANVPNRDVVTTTGKQLTLVNPAFMARQVHGLAREQDGESGHITSLRPLRPENRPDPWEEAALEAFARGAKEVAEVSDFEGGTYLRFMRPMVTEAACLKCHAAQGYGLGDLRGGLSVSVPMAPFLAESRAVAVSAAWRHGVLGMGGLAAIALTIVMRSRTERVRGEAQRRVVEAEERLQSALRGADLASWDYAVARQAFAYDERWEQLRGNPARDKVLDAGSRRELIHPEDWGRVDQALTAHVVGETGEYRAEYRISRSDGTWRWMMDRGRATQRDPGGRALRVCGTILDITSRKEAESALEASEWRYRLVSEQASDWVFWIDSDGRMLFNSPSCETITGYEPGDFGDRRDPFSELVHPDDRELWKQHQCEAREGRIGDLLIRILHKDGRTRWLHHLCRPMQDDSGAFVGSRASNRDVTVRLLAERERDATSSTLQAVLDAQRVGILVETVDRKALFTNQAFRSMFHIPNPEALAGADCREQAELAKSGFDDPERFVHDIDATVARGKAVCDYELRDVHGRVFKRDYVPVVEGGLTIRHLWQHRDVTEELDLQSRLREAEKLQVVGRLAAGVAHDFNNILMIIQGNSSELVEELRAHPDAAHMANQITTASQRAAALVRQLLAFSGKTLIHPVALDLNKVIADLTSMLRRSLGEHVTIELELGASIPRVRADAGTLDQIVLNLATNARDAMPGGGTLTIRTSAVERRIGDGKSEEETTGTFVCLTVTDSGVGMSEPVRSHIFEPFFTTKGVGEGSGLGLSSVLGSARQHGGWVEVDSAPGEGTTIRVFLPAMSDCASEGEEQPAASATRGRGRVVLVVEDEPMVLELIRRTLEHQGYAVRTATSGAQALELPRDELEGIDLLLTDVVMPGGVGGHELAQRLRAVRPDLPVLLCTGYSPETVGNQAEALHGARVLQKPFRPAELWAAVEDALGGRHAGTTGK